MNRNRLQSGCNIPSLLSIWYGK